MRVNSPVRYIPDPRIGRARVGIQPGWMVPAQPAWPPVRLFGPGHPVPALRTVSPHQASSASPQSVMIHGPEPAVMIHGTEPAVRIYGTEPPATVSSPEPPATVPSPEPPARVPNPGPAARVPSPGPAASVPNPGPAERVPSPVPAERAPSPGLATRVPAPEAPPKWRESEVERGLRPEPEPPPRVDAHPDPPL
ncbi:uncharacterized protein LOC135572648 [Oncorhynchus nerka]|uniref:uncharacterized protein LOC135572648 n=1 Tax=Oncorhynchus nerka TaxID=8023 RepID=UPI0031B8AECE